VVSDIADSSPFTGAGDKRLQRRNATLREHYTIAKHKTNQGKSAR
jgi:hypothetical protein